MSKERGGVPTSLTTDQWAFPFGDMDENGTNRFILRVSLRVKRS